MIAPVLDQCKGAVKGFSSTPSTDIEILAGLTSISAIGKPGSPNRLLYSEFQVDTAGDGTARLMASPPDARCGAAQQITLVDGTAEGRIQGLLALNPSQTRVAYIDTSMASGGTRLATIGVDGTDRRIILGTDRLTGVIPVWLDDTHLAWAETDTDEIISVAPDAVGSGASGSVDRQERVRCVRGDVSRIAQFAITPFGTLIRTLGGRLGRGIHLVESNGCAAAKTLVSAAEFDSVSAFSLAPDKQTIVFSATPAGGADADVYTLVVDGTSDPIKRFGDDQGDDVYPTFTPDGRQVVWTQLTFSGTVPSGSGMHIANLDGRYQRVLAAQDPNPTETIVVANVYSGDIVINCGVAPHQGGSTPWGFWGFVAGLGWFLSQRRRAAQHG